MEIVSHFPNTYLIKARFSLYTSIRATHGNTLNAEANMKIQLSSFKSDTEEICNNLRILFFSQFFVCFCLFQKIEFLYNLAPEFNQDDTLSVTMVPSITTVKIINIFITHKGLCPFIVPIPSSPIIFECKGDQEG